MNDILATSGATTSSNCPSPITERKPLNTEVDWTEHATADDHIWISTSASGDLCYIGEDNCVKTGSRKKCLACHIVVHDDCLRVLERIGFGCKTTFREGGQRSIREQVYFVRHHWVHRRKMEGKCRQCGKSFEKRFGFRDTKIIAISCSWCKQAYHNKVSCFRMQNLSEPCKLGVHANAILPPTWVVKQPNQRNPKSTNRLRSKKKRLSGSGSCRKKSMRESSSRSQSPFIIKPITSQTPYHRPILVFINPKSGGNQGCKLIQSFQNILNPRQVFDLNKRKPQEVLELFRKVPNVRVLACGGDGTVGWILSTLDKMSLPKPPPVAILPLGTGNDLSRTLNFGPGYTDEAVSKIIQGVEDSKVVKLDRWKLRVTKNTEVTSTNKSDEDEGIEDHLSVDEPPLKVINNYFSIGVDAKVSLEFHNCREANPNKFSSRIGNKMFYARASVLEYLTSKTNDLSKHLTIYCDGKNYTHRIRELKPVCILFLNIPRYASGTNPWGHPTGTELTNQRIDDRMIEVLTFSNNQLGMLWIGGHGERICQCRSAEIITTEGLPMQIDGEPFRLNPSNIRVDFFKQSNMLQKGKRRTSARSDCGNTNESKLRIGLVTSRDYDSCNGRKTQLLRLSSPLLVTVANIVSPLSSLRQSLEAVYPVERTTEPISYRWVFLDASGNDKCYQVDRNQEKSLLLHEIKTCDNEIFVLDLKPPPPKPPTYSWKKNKSYSKTGIIRRVSKEEKLEVTSASSVEDSKEDFQDPQTFEDSKSQEKNSSSGHSDPDDLKSKDEDQETTLLSANDVDHKPNFFVEVVSANANQSSNVTSSETMMTSWNGSTCQRCSSAQRTLLESAMRNDVLTMKRAIYEGAEVEDTIDDLGFSALHLSVIHKSDRVFDFLLKKRETDHISVQFVHVCLL